MSLAIVFKGTEGIVLAADSRVTLTTAKPALPGMLASFTHSTFDNATKFLKVKDQNFVGAVTFGVGAIGQTQPRTAHSFIPEFEQELRGSAKGETKTPRLPVKDFADRLGQFFLKKWKELGMPDIVDPSQNMEFIIGGYDEGEAYGTVYGLQIPHRPVPTEWHSGQFGVVWGGQSDFVHRLIAGYDPNLPRFAQECLKLDDQQIADLVEYLRARIQAPIPFQFLPLQDCVNLAILLVRATMTIQTFTIGLRGVGGPIDVATITRTDGLKDVQTKEISGETLPK